MIDYIENSINHGRHVRVLRAFLWTASHILRFMPTYDYKRLICDGRMLLEYQAKRPKRAEDVLCNFSRYQSPSAWAITTYIANSINRGVDHRSDAILGSAHLAPELAPLITSAIKRRDGDLRGALELLDPTVGIYPARMNAARARRGIFHQLQDHLSLAVDGITFLQREPQQFLIPFTITTAGSAEGVKRHDIFRLALRRLLRDRERIRDNPKKLKLHWNDALKVSMTVFDVDGAVEIAGMAKALGKKAAETKLDTLLQIREEISVWKDVVDAAYASLRAKAEGKEITDGRADVVLVVPAAAFNTNVIDYPGFRQEIRFVVQTIAETLKLAGVSFRVEGRIRTHGELSFAVPSFSYHTISTDRKALHFKETDRPSRFSFDTGGYAGWSDFSSRSVEELDLDSVDQEKAKAFFRAEQVAVIEGNVSKYAQAELTFTEPLPERFVFIGLQVIGDAVQQLAYSSPFAMMDEVIDTCMQRGLSVVVKRHPQDKSGQISDYLRARVEKGHVTVSTASIHTLIAKSEAVCVINSGVGAEALLHEKPVYVFGKADYMRACFVCEKPGDFAKQFYRGRTRLTSDQLYRFWYVLRNRYAVSLRDREKSAAWIRTRVLRHLRETGVLPAES